VVLKTQVSNTSSRMMKLVGLRDKPQMGIAGRLASESDGPQIWVTTEAPVTPTPFKRARLLFRDGPQRAARSGLGRSSASTTRV
jgi:hypothetical protein